MAAIQFKIKKHVTVPLLKVPDNGAPVYVRFEEPIYRSTVPEIEKKKYETALKKYQEAIAAGETDVTAPQAPNPPELAKVVNLETGEHMEIIVSTVLGAELRESYSGDTYVMKGFEIKKFKMQNGKRYATFQIAELELEETIAHDGHQEENAESSGKGKKK